MGTRIKGSQIKQDSRTGDQIADDAITGSDIDESTLNISASSLSGAFSFPDVDGSANQILKTDGNGNLTWQDEAAAAPSSEPQQEPDSGEEIASGSWTPGLEHGYSLQGTAYGRYQRVGSQVTVWFKFNVGQDNNTATQEMKITGLPYGALGTGIWSTGPQPHGLTFQCTTNIRSGENVIRFMDQTLTSAKQISNFASEGAVRGTITYWIGS